MNKAQEIIKPQKSGIFRTIFLYVGQGDATIMAIPDSDTYNYLLIDCNLDKENEGINLIKLLKDLLGDNKLNIFINTHPHNDHLGGIKDIYEDVGIKEVWHSGHKPSKKHDDAYKNLEYVIKKIGGDNVFLLKGSSEEDKLDEHSYSLGDIHFNVLAPAEYVCEDIKDEQPEKRYARIHEQCGVIRFSYGSDPARILITGDSDLVAWKEHIIAYHSERVSVNVLSASHHGSRSFFKEDEDDDPYKDHIEKISPTYCVVSAPKQSESKHDHPHDDAMKLYKEYIDDDNLIHLGDYKNSKVCVIVDIDNDGSLDIKIDDVLWENYKFKDDDGKNGDKKFDKEKLAGIYPITQLDNKPMGK